MVAGQVGVQLLHAASALLKNNAGRLSEAIKPILEVSPEVLENAAVGKLDPSCGRGEQVKNALQAFSESLNGQATEEERKFLDGLLKGELSLDDKGNLEKLLGIAQDVKGLSMKTDSTGQGLLFDVDEHNNNPKQKANSSNNDTEVVLRNMLELINLKITKKNGHIYMFLKWAGPALRMCGINVPTPEELPQKVEKALLKNERFVGALRKCIENKEVDTTAMPWWQKRIFSSSRKLFSHLAERPDSILESAPQAAYALRYSSGAIIPLLGKIPFVGRILGMAFPFVVDELNAAGEIKEQEFIKNILGVLAKTHKAQPAAQTSGSK